MNSKANQSPFAGTFVPTPRNAAHRRSMLIDALAYLDMKATHSLIVFHHATQGEVTDAIAQTEHTADEVGQALAAWLQTDAPSYLDSKTRGRLINFLTQPTLLELS
ncbi:hypothetical protein [Glycomyces artemisiae]|uniref:Uncharacterized protein n=1 Tax=Glycomyces artemisiae TaxID=1076443 RepID=A0A2T0U6J0_9ACTN|nr:hypothetical protein [Glycomyces artemisiae]PRY53527.1 hypothetical protein B0I28_11726 [Glycomyces artemisiae]